MTMEREVSTPTRITRRRLLMAAGATALLPTLDVASALSLSSPMTAYERSGEHAGTLSAAIPGFLAADVRLQTSPLHEVWDRAGDSVMIQATGGVYNEQKMAEFTAEEITSRLSARQYDHLVMNGVSMGGNVAYDALQLLQSNRTLEEYSTRASAIMYDTPASKTDIPSNLARLSPLAEYPAGRLTNLLPRVNFMDGSLAASQADALFDREAPNAGSLDFLEKLIYWESLQGGDMVNAFSAIRHWHATVSDDTFRHEFVDMKHTAFEANVELSRTALSSIYRSFNT